MRRINSKSLLPALRVCAAFLLLFAVLFAAAASAAGGTLRFGDSGADVKELQRRLKQWGYYTGVVDGVFGS